MQFNTHGPASPDWGWLNTSKIRSWAASTRFSFSSFNRNPVLCFMEGSLHSFSTGRTGLVWPSGLHCWFLSLSTTRNAHAVLQESGCSPACKSWVRAKPPSEFKTFQTYQTGSGWDKDKPSTVKVEGGIYSYSRVLLVLSLDLKACLCLKNNISGSGEDLPKYWALLER